MANGYSRGYGRRSGSFSGIDTSGTAAIGAPKQDSRSYKDVQLFRERQELENDTARKQNELTSLNLNEQMRVKGEQDYIRNLQQDWYSKVNSVGDSIYSGGSFDYNPIVGRTFSSFNKDKLMNDALLDAKSKGVQVSRGVLEQLYSEAQNAEVRHVMKKLGQQKTLSGLDTGEFNVSLRAGEPTFTGPNIIAAMLADSNLGTEEYQVFNDKTGFNPRYETLLEKLPGAGPDTGVGAAPGIVTGAGLIGGGAAMYAGGRRGARSRIDNLRSRAELLKREAKAGKVLTTRNFGKDSAGKVRQGFVPIRNQAGKVVRLDERKGGTRLKKGKKLSKNEIKTWSAIAEKNIKEADKLTSNLGQSWIDKAGPKGRAGRALRKQLKRVGTLGKGGIGFYAPDVGGAIGASSGKALTGTEGGEAGGRLVGTAAGGVGRGLAAASMGRGFVKWIAKKFPKMAGKRLATGAVGGPIGWLLAVGLTAKDIADLYAEYQATQGN